MRDPADRPATRSAPPAQDGAPRVPCATYRLQLRRGFGFSEALELLPYLETLGITDLYLSPVFRARPGSTHGYDVTDPNRFNPELGTLEDFEALAEAVRKRGMGLILDIVPNHMAVNFENRYWRDILQNGPSSRHADFFDIAWDIEEPEHPRVLVPCLGRPYGQVLEDQQLVLDWSPQGFVIRYWDNRFPVDPKTWGQILGERQQTLIGEVGGDHAAARGLRDLLAQIERLPDRTRTDRVARLERRRGIRALVRSIRRLRSREPEFRRYLDETVRACNGSKGDPASFDRLDRLLDAQAFRLAYWKVATESSGYRRFFDISDLVGVRVEVSRVFAETHELLLRLAREGKVTGFRVDHIDGLFDPYGYLRRLQNYLAPGRDPGSAAFFVVVEKILTGEERLAEDWPVQGTTGYDGLVAIQSVLVDPDGFTALERGFLRTTGRGATFREQVRHDKRRVLEGLLAGEVASLARQLTRIARRDRHARHLSRRELEHALVTMTALLPVYRTYVRDFAIRPDDRRLIEALLAELASEIRVAGGRMDTSGGSRAGVGDRAAGGPGEAGDAGDADARRQESPRETLEFLRRLFLLEFPDYLSDERRHQWLRLLLHWQQLSSPAMAKGLEDTAHYVHTPLAALNEVGGEPHVPVDPVAAFHAYAQHRALRWPHTLVASSTHDTKRSEDARARLCALSEIPSEWSRRLARWTRANKRHAVTVRRHRAPSRREEWLLYQSLLAIWPLEDDLYADDPEASVRREAFLDRMRGFTTKAAREAKLHTSWLRPSEAHEDALHRFLASILSPENDGFLRDFRLFAAKVSWYGMLNSLSQLVLKCASPGVPDFYQGTELWDFSLVDPDNRRPVDFARRIAALEPFARHAGVGRPGFDALRDGWRDGRLKLWTTLRCLDLRRRTAAAFLEGDYFPLEAAGSRADHLCAFARRAGSEWILAATPRLCASLVDPDVFPLGPRVWGRGTLALPSDAPRHWRDALTGMEVECSPGTDGRLPLAALFRELPVVVLEATSATAAKRRSSAART